MKNKMIRIGNVRINAELLLWYKPVDYEYKSGVNYEIVIAYMNGGAVCQEYESYMTDKERDLRLTALDTLYVK